jgi:hypothetical protein
MKLTRLTTSPQATIEAADLSAQGGGDIAAGLTNLVTFPWKDGVALLGQAADGSVDSYLLTATAPYVTPAHAKIDLGGKCDILQAFVIGGVQHLIAYYADSGKLSFHRVNADLSVSKAFVYSRLRSPGLTAGWTMLQPLTYLGMVYYVSYDSKTGTVEMFDVNVTAVAQGDQPPLQTMNVWSWQWAHGWQNFAFFQLGGENFFFKINVEKPNVNIDHLSLDPNSRSNEVCTQKGDLMPYNQDKGLIVRSIAMTGGTPYLVTYQPSGETAFLRVTSDCQGWMQEAQATNPSGASDIVTYRIGADGFVLVY